MNEFGLEVVGLTKKYSGTNKPALNNVSFSIPKGRVVGLIGLNGAGKSTLINLISSVIKSDQGDIIVSGKNLKLEPMEVRKNLGCVFQGMYVNPFFSIEKMLSLHCSQFGKSDNINKARELLAELDLLSKKNCKPGSLSGGMIRRVMFAKAIMHNPEVIILDELSTGMDVDVRKITWNLLKKLSKQGKTIMLSTHYLEEIEELCQDALIINEGEVVAYEKCSEIMNRLPSKNYSIEVSSKSDVSEGLKQFAKNKYNARACKKNAKTIILTLEKNKSLGDALQVISKKCSITDITRKSNIEDAVMTTINAKKNESKA